MVVSLRFSDIQGFWTICFNTTKQFETFHVTSQFPNEIPWVLGLFLGQCLAPTYDEAGADLADAMARLHVPEVGPIVWRKGV